MFDRVGYKRAARAALKGYWKYPLMVSAICCAVCFFLAVSDQLLAGAVPYASKAGLIYVLAVFAVIGIIQLGTFRFFLDFSCNRETAGLESFFIGLGCWIKGALGFLWLVLWLFLWGILLIIPAIVKKYAYSMMFFILAEHPRLSVRKAMLLSKVMTLDHKGDLFVMDVSFAGWMLLCVFSAGIGLLWLIPYMLLSYAYAYRFLKTAALERGLLKIQDFEEL